MTFSQPNPKDQINAKNLSFVYESVYKANRDEISAIMNKEGEKPSDSPDLDKYKALNLINLSICQGKFIAMVGDTGSGKSTLVRTFNGLIPSFYRGIFFGYVGVFGKDSIQEKISTLSQDVGLVFQNPENQLVAMTVEREIAFGLENIGLKRELIQKKISQILEYLGISHLRMRHPYELSGGEQQRVAIASIMTLEPSIIILDEPTATLDPQAAESVLNLLEKLNKDKKITIIIIEHRLEVILPYCTEIIIVQNGQILQHASTQEVLNSDYLYSTNVRIPEYIILFKKLKSNKIYSGIIPSTIEQAAHIMRELIS
ncbi:MAG: ABC transporter ATP-binding protein [Promethearchaeota archaeon]|nr:MAG: ABC transporter ATP-binding protein [Candidatus Lokiarchaeota archaeon]